jgi:HAD superfamily hydrolase (TIGR01450 family)
MLDLDGVIYVGPEAVPGVPEHLAEARAEGMTLAFVTNNASRPPDAVAAHLTELGVPAGRDDVVTAAQAAARLLAEDLSEGSRVYVIGGEGLFVALEDEQLQPVQSPEDDAAAVVSGYHRDLRWGTVIDGAILVRDGLPWVASNTDLTVPTPHGPGPGNGVLVRAVAEFAGVTPRVAGKPEPPLLHETQRRVGGKRPLVVGDRLDTDIEGACRAGYDSLLVMTGVTDLETLVGVEREHRPTYLSATLAGLLEEQHPPERDGSAWHQGEVHAHVEDGRVAVDSGAGADPGAWWRVVAAAAWAHLDDTGRPAEVAGLAPPQPRDGADAR